MKDETKLRRIRAFAKSLAEEGVRTASQVDALITTYLSVDPISQTALGEQIYGGPAPAGKTLATAVRDQLAERELVEIVRADGDRRSVYTAITDKGISVLGAALREMEAAK